MAAEAAEAAGVVAVMATQHAGQTHPCTALQGPLPTEGMRAAAVEVVAAEVPARRLQMGPTGGTVRPDIRRVQVGLVVAVVGEAVRLHSTEALVVMEDGEAMEAMPLRWVAGGPCSSPQGATEAPAGTEVTRGGAGKAGPTARVAPTG